MPTSPPFAFLQTPAQLQGQGVGGAAHRPSPSAPGGSEPWGAEGGRGSAWCCCLARRSHNGRTAPPNPGNLWGDRLALQKGLEASAREKANQTTQRIPPPPTHALQRRNLSLGLHQACCFVYATIDLPSQFAESRHLGALLCHFDKSCEARSHSLSGAAFAHGAPVTGPLEFSSESLEARWGGQHSSVSGPGWQPLCWTLDMSPHPVPSTIPTGMPHQPQQCRQGHGLSEILSELLFVSG